MRDKRRFFMEKLLSELKILDFSIILPGPFATMFLSDLGADVIRVENPYNPDLLRVLTPFLDKENKYSYYHAHINRNKKSMSLDLKKKESIEIIMELIKEYDIVVEQFRPGVMAKLGLSYEDLKKVNPGIIYCSITGYGQTGPLKNRAGHDINYLSTSGIMSYSGRKDIGPNQMGIQVADIGGGSYNTIIGILAAALNRTFTGKGRHIDVSMTDCLFSFQINAAGKEFADEGHMAYGNDRLNGGSIYGFYEAGDGKFLSFGGLEPKFFNNFCDTLGLPELKKGGVEQIGMDLADSQRKVAEAVKKQPRDYWLKKFDELDACVAPVLTFDEAIETEYVKSRELIVEIMGPHGEKVKQVAMPIKFSDFKPEYKKPGGLMGEDNIAVLKSLGYEDPVIEEMKQKGVFGPV